MKSPTKLQINERDNDDDDDRLEKEDDDDESKPASVQADD